MRLACSCVLLLTAALLAGCGTTTRVATEEPDAATTAEPPRPEASADDEARLRAEVDEWLGVPHRWGGTTRDGVDCSAFVQILYREVFGTPLPRTTYDQMNVGTPISQETLRPGDLVFFVNPSKTRHVGVYLSDGTFAHASSSQGVTISEMQLPYWRRGYLTARRVLATSGESIPRPDAPARTDATPGPRPPDRVGW